MYMLAIDRGTGILTLSPSSWSRSRLSFSRSTPAPRAFSRRLKKLRTRPSKRRWSRPVDLPGRLEEEPHRRRVQDLSGDEVGGGGDQLQVGRRDVPGQIDGPPGQGQLGELASTPGVRRRPGERRRRHTESARRRETTLRAWKPSRSVSGRPAAAHHGKAGRTRTFKVATASSEYSPADPTSPLGSPRSWRRSRKARRSTGSEGAATDRKCVFRISPRTRSSGFVLGRGGADPQDLASGSPPGLRPRRRRRHLRVDEPLEHAAVSLFHSTNWLMAETA